MMTYGLVFIVRSAIFFPRMMSEFRLRNHWRLGRCVKARFQAQTNGTLMKVVRLWASEEAFFKLFVIQSKLSFTGIIYSVYTPNLL